MLDHPAHDPLPTTHYPDTYGNYGHARSCLFRPALLLPFSLLKETHCGEAACHKSTTGSQHLVSGSSKKISRAIFICFVSPISFEKT
jgi:hypothetical protein